MSTTKVVDYTAADLERVKAAREYVHARLCWRGDRSPGPCMSCPTGTGTLLALRVLDVSPRDARAARRALHDVVCRSGCGAESDHADRTQSKTAAALRKFRESEQS